VTPRRGGTRLRGQRGTHQQRITAHRGLLAPPAGNIKGVMAADRQCHAAEPGAELDG